MKFTAAYSKFVNFIGIFKQMKIYDIFKYYNKNDLFNNNVLLLCFIYFQKAIAESVSNDMYFVTTN